MPSQRGKNTKIDLQSLLLKRYIFSWRQI